MEKLKILEPKKEVFEPLLWCPIHQSLILKDDKGFFCQNGGEEITSESQTKMIMGRSYTIRQNLSGNFVLKHV